MHGSQHASQLAAAIAPAVCGYGEQLLLAGLRSNRLLERLLQLSGDEACQQLLACAGSKQG